MAVNMPPPLPRPTVTPNVDRAVALGIQKKNANHALALRDAGQGFANAMAAMSALAAAGDEVRPLARGLYAG